MTSSATSRPASPESGDATSPSTELAAERPIVAILADDLIWSTRLAAAATEAGAQPIRLRSIDALVGSGDPPSAASPFVIVDLTARAYDGIEAVRLARAGGAAVLAVGQHDDLAGRKAALEAGATRVLAYRKLFEDGPGVIRRWLEAADASRST